MIKRFIPATLALAAAALIAPSFAFAQSEGGAVTRAQVKQQLVELEQAGYNPTGAQLNYPADLQAAQARVNANQASYGSSPTGTSQSGAGVVPVAATSGPNSIYRGQ